MADRFERLFELPSNLFSVESPVIVSAGALLKDTQTGNIVVQLKYQSVSSVTIKALCVDIAAYDVGGNEIQGKKNYQYLDLAIKSGQAFGSNKAIVMPDVTTRSFAISSLSVVLSDGSTVSVSLPLEKLPGSLSLQQALGRSELVKQYRIETNKDANYVPSEAMGLWKCACGEWNAHQLCTKCHLTKATAFTAYNFDNLSSSMDDRLEAEERAKREYAERNAAMEKQQKARNKKMTIIGSVLALIVVAISAYSFWIYPDVIKPSIMYNEAQKLLAEAKYEEAATAFDALGNYKDSDEKADESRDLLVQEKLSEADKLLERGKYVEALDAYTAIGKEFPQVDVDDLLAETNYRWAMDFYNEKSYYDASKLFESIMSYKDSASFYCSSCQNLGDEYLSLGDYDTALKLYGLAKADALVYQNAYEWFEKRVALAEKACDSIEGLTSDLIVVLRSDGTVYATGENEHGECNVEHWTNIVDVSAAYTHTVGLREDGTVVATGANQHGQCDVGSWQNIVAIETEDGRTVGLRADGTIVAVGRNDRGQCDVEHWTGVIDIALTDYLTIGLRSDGTVLIAGYTSPIYDYERYVHDWTNIKAITTDFGIIAGLTFENGVITNGNRISDSKIATNAWEHIVGIYTNSEMVFGIKNDGTLEITGDTHDYSVEDLLNGTNIVAVSADWHNMVALHLDGTVTVEGSTSEYDQDDVSDWTNIVGIRCHDDCLIGLRSDGTLLIVGEYSDNIDISEWTDIHIPS